ncbi:MAG: C-terminal binding protein [Microbacterium sp.]
MHRIVITDADYETFEAEEDEASALGVELAIEQCRTEDDVIRVAQEADALVVQYAPITARVLEALPRVKAVSRYGVGIDMIDEEAAAEHGVAVCNVPDYGVEDVSDHAIALALTVARATARLDRAMRAGERDLARFKPLYRIQGRSFVCLGLGRIGQATARKALGLGYRVSAYDPFVTPEQLPAELSSVELVDLDEALRRAQVLSLHLPLTDETRHTVDARALALLPDDAIVVNTCRGGVIDTEALLEALRAERIAGAGLDVFEEEPLSDGHPLTALDNVVITPHAAWYSEESFDTLKRRTIRNAVDALRADGA